ncbi:MAG: methyltransferase domain-containing protein [Candidatus Methanoperedens sp.]|nr:methyltransferase domain-containing protein [Candidatus Methanoperedens sp.]
MIFRISHINESLFINSTRSQKFYLPAEKPLSIYAFILNKNMVHKFDVKKAAILDDPGRMQILNPEIILDKLHLTGEMVIADLGCGTGFFSIPASKRVKKVFALDIQQEMLDILLDKIKKEKITNIETLLSGESFIPLPDNSVDLLLMVNVFHELGDKLSILKEVKRVLGKSGRLVIIDWEKIEMDFGPPFEERFDEKEVIDICNTNGFKVIEQSYAGLYNYLLMFVLC